MGRRGKRSDTSVNVVVINHQVTIGGRQGTCRSMQNPVSGKKGLLSIDLENRRTIFTIHWLSDDRSENYSQELDRSIEFSVIFSEGKIEIGLLNLELLKKM